MPAGKGRTRWSVVAVVVVVVGAAAGIALLREYKFGLYVQVALAVCGAVLLALVSLAEPDRYNVRTHAKVSMLLTLALTWSAAVVSAAIVTRLSPRAEWFATLLLSATSIGGLFALQRSARTRSETGAGLREMSGLRVTSLSAPLIQQQVNALEVTTVDQLLQVAVRMLRLAVSLPLTPSSHLVDKSALWLFDDKARSWLVVASSSTDPSDSLVFPALAKECPGGGIIPNLALGVSPAKSANTFHNDDVFLCASQVRDHPWFRPGGGGTVEGMAIVLLRQHGEILGALSLTTRHDEAIPVTGPRCSELVDILGLWAKSFVVPLARLYSLREAAS